MNSPSAPAETMQVAFDYVARVYRECSYLMLDFQDQMDGHGFYVVNPDIGTEPSRQVRQPDMWMPRFLSSYWQPKKGGVKRVYVGMTLAFFHPDNKAIQPVLIYGIARGMNDERAVKPRMYLWYAGMGYESAFKYAKPGVSPLEASGELVRFSCNYPDASYVWPKCGYVRSVPLTEIQGVDRVVAVCEELKDLWNKYAAKL